MDLDCNVLKESVDVVDVEPEAGVGAVRRERNEACMVGFRIALGGSRIG